MSSVLNFFRSDSIKKSDDITIKGVQDNWTDVEMGSEEARETIGQKEQEVSKGKHRLDEKERNLSERGRDASSQECLTAEGRQNSMTQRRSLINNYERQLERMRQERSAAIKEAKEAAVKLTLSDAEVVNLRRELHESQKQLEQCQHRNRALEEQLHCREKDIQAAQDRSEEMKLQHGLTRKLLEARTLELQGAQSFLTTADALSGAEVSLMVEELNGEIFQMAAFMVDSFKFQETRTGDDQTGARTRTREILGSTMLDLLSSIRHSEDPLVIQIALQACMTKFARWAIVMWHLDSSNGQSLLVGIHSQLRGSGRLSSFASKMLKLK
jgi:hypothetical protein